MQYSFRKIYRALFPKIQIKLNTRTRMIKKRRQAHYYAHKETARKIVFERLIAYNSYYNFAYNRVTIRSQRSRWGSCSKKGNLNFNYLLMFLPEPLLDSVIVHELCHLKEFNHSKRFWNLVGEQIPDYAIRKKQLARISAFGLRQ